jgi:molecular chaperone Hsp33
LLTATALVGGIQKRRGLLSLQIIGRGQLRTLFADMTHDGHLRGYVKNPHIGFPLAPGEDRSLRIAIGHAIAPGSCTLIREPEKQDFVQSTTDLVSGEIDEDIEAAVRQSDQILTALHCDVLLDERIAVRYAAGVIMQPLPHGDPDVLEDLAARLRDGKFARALIEHKGDVLAVVRSVAPAAETIEEVQSLVWQCRCSQERVRGALQMLPAHDLTEMIAKADNVKVTCDFCGTVFEVDVDEIRAAHDQVIATKN